MLVEMGRHRKTLEIIQAALEILIEHHPMTVRQVYYQLVSRQGHDRWPGGLTRDRMGELVAEGVNRFGWRLVVLEYLGVHIPRDTNHNQFDSDLRNSTVLRKLARTHDVALLLVATLRDVATYRGPELTTVDDIAGARRLVDYARTVGVVSGETSDDDTGLVCFRPLKVRLAPTRDDEVIQPSWRPRTGAMLGLTPDEDG